jgi:ribonuclease HI
MDDDLRDVVQRELALLDPEVRKDADRVRALLHPDFVEYGSSGRVWDRTSVPAATSQAAGHAAGHIEAGDLRPRRLGPDVVLLTYRTTTPGRSVLRSSTWVRDGAAGWLLLFHQGTPTSQGAAAG